MEQKLHFGIVNFEKRRHPRFSVDLPIEYFRIDSKEKHAGHTGDASESGLMIYLPEQIEIGQFLSLKLYFSSYPNLNTIGILGQVVWTDIHFGKEGDYKTGLRIVDVSMDDFTKLKDFLNNLAGMKALPIPKKGERP